MELVVDFHAGFEGAYWNPIWEDFYRDWRELWFNERVEPPSWVVGDEAIAAGAKGILFRSRFREGGTNLVIYPETLDATDAVTVFDHGGALRKNQDSCA